MKLPFLSYDSLTFCFRGLLKVLLRLMCIPIFLSLTACGGGGFIISSIFALLILASIGNGIDDDDNGNPVPPPALPVTNLTVIPDETSIRLGWTNPDQDDIDAFNISRQETENPTTPIIFPVTRDEPMNVNFASEATTSFVIDGLDNNTNYNLGVLVVYADGSMAQSAEISVTTGINSDNDNEIDFFDNDDDNDGLEDGEDNCRTVRNPQQEDVNNDGQGDACETDPAERPATEGVSDPVITPGETELHLNWTNPVGFITAFNISWINSGDDTDTGMGNIDMSRERTNTRSETSTDFVISPLTNNTNYMITITLVADAGNSYATEIRAETGTNSDNDNETDRVDNDDDNDGIPDFRGDGTTPWDNCRTVFNPQQKDVNNDGQGDACETDASEQPATAGVINPVITPGETVLSLNWTNPEGFITAFNISWVNLNNPADAGAVRIDDFNEENNTASETNTSFRISSLTRNTNYRITINLTADAGNSYPSKEILAVTGVNKDNDTIPDIYDVDDDNDGLIEIRTAEELNNIRHNLAGTGWTQAVGAAANSAGCPADSGCNGYELTENISLAESNWLPIGDDEHPFTANFDGNGNVISNVTIANEGNALGERAYIGFFARVMEASIKNLGMVIERIVAEDTPGGTYFGGLSGRISNTEIVNSYIIFSDVLSIEDDQPGTFFGGLSGLADNTTVERFYVVLPNSISIRKSLMEPGTLTIGGMFGDNEASNPERISSLTNSYIIYRGDPAITATDPTNQNLTASINGFGTDNVRVENSYALFAGNLPVATPAINLTLGILPGSSSVHNSYFNARTNTDDPRYRTPEQLRCPTAPECKL